MATVMEMLEGRVAADMPPESRPLPAVEFTEPLSSPGAQNGGTGNNVPSLQIE
jgi:hypothetical protein